MDRKRAKEEFQKIAKTGQGITLRWFTEQSIRLFGEQLSLQTIRMWSFEDRWFHGIVELDSQELSRLTHLFDLAYESLVESIHEDGLGKDVSAYGRCLREVCAKIPREVLPHFEDQIADVRVWLFTYLDKEWRALLSNHASSIMKTYLELNRYVIVPMEPDSDGDIDADAILMKK